MKRWFEALGCAIEGILIASKTERHLKFHLNVAVALLILCLIFGINRWEFVILILMATIVITAELFNSAVESVVDIISPQKQDGARMAKDIAAGAVLVPSVVSLVAAYFILKPYVIGFYLNGVKIARHSGGDIAVAAVIIIMILVIIIKSYLGKEHPLKGGMPSGYTALAFSISVSVTIIYQGALVLIISFIAALLIALSRIISQARLFREVFAGAVLGSVVTLILFKMFY